MPDQNGTQNQPPETTTTNMRSALILGLGGTGLEIMMMIRRMIVERFGSLDELPIVSFLHLDTARDEADLTPRNVLGIDISLRESERISLQMPQINDGGAQYLAQRPGVKEWFPEQLRIEHSFTRGAGAVRAFGRIAFSENAQKIERTLDEKIRILDNRDAREYVASKGTSVDNGIDIYLVCSLLGGTGSGTFIDAAYLLRKVLRKYANTQILGYLNVGGGNCGELRNRANCYGALKELVYYSSRAQQLKSTNEDAFSVAYPGLNRYGSQAVPPFDFCYLATNFNERELQLDKAQLFEMTAENIFLEFTPGVAATKRAIRDNIGANQFSSLDNRLHQAQCFLSFGIASIEFPALRVQECLAWRLAGETMNSLVFEQAKVDATIPQKVNQDLQTWGLTPELLTTALISDNAGVNIINQITNLKNNQQATLQNYFPHNRRDELIQYLKNHLDGTRGHVRVDIDPNGRGAYIRQIEAKGEQLLERAISELRRRVADMISSSYGGIRNALSYLESLDAGLSNYAGQYQTGEEANKRREPLHSEEETKSFAKVTREKSEANDREIGLLVSKTLQASLSFSRATVLSYINRQARLLLIGEKDANGHWLGDSLLREVESLKSRIESYKKILATFARDFVGEKKRDDESGQAVWNGGKYREHYNNLTVGSFNSDVMVQQSEIDDLYQRHVPNPDEEYIGVKDEIEQKLGQDNTPLSIFWCVLEHPEDVRRIVIAASRRRFLAVRDISIAEKLSSLDQPEVNRKLGELLKRSHSLLRFNDQLFAQDNNGNRLTAHDPGYHSIKLLATCHPQRDSAVNLNPLPNSPASKLAIAYQQVATGIRTDHQLPDRYRLVIVQEKGVFPLYCVRDFEELHKDYLYITEQSGEKPCETHRQINFPDLFPLSDDEEKMPIRVETALTLARIFGFVSEGRDFTTEDPAIFCKYKDDDYIWRSVNLGRNWQEAIDLLSQRQVDKEVRRKQVDSQTSLDLIEGLLKTKGQEAKSRTDKERGWAFLQDYLVRLVADLPGGADNPIYLKESEFIGTFRKEYDWTKPSDYVPSKLKNNGTDNNGNGQLPPDEEEFRQNVLLLIRNHQGRPLSSEEITQLMEEGIDFYHLKAGVAKRIIDEAQKTSALTSLPEPEAKLVEAYRKACLVALQNGTVSAEDRQTLEARRLRLNLTPEQAEAIEQDVVNSRVTLN